MLRATGGWDRAPQPVGHCEYEWPDVSQWPVDDDLIGQGADLNASTIIDGYRHGLFAMERNSDDPVLFWWSPAERCVIPLDGLRITRSMRRSARRYHIRINTNFERVMLGCASRGNDDKVWITPRFIDQYCDLHDRGWAHSVETYNEDGVLVGGLYGVRIKKFFAGESMFHMSRDASKVALMALVDIMRSAKMTLLDAQWHTPHLASLGGIVVPRADYLARLRAATTP
ncbi:leucyl/phenylalanyl-tRNA--protein transferase [Actinomycetes bacterium]|nr:leucyl/phenylalanyl-tRNA--protein transferase [Actinomycetes bacterium]